MPARVNNETFASEVLGSEIAVLADFYSDSCVPCKMLSPVLSQLESEYNGKLKIVKINVNFDAELAEQYDVTAAPTLIVFRNGAEAARHIGAATKDDIIGLLGSLI